ncbi:MAG: minor capsid protein [Ruminococcus sp.]|jgi:hypothetical protein|nr:minor capsid protein [Ruminococcus sp.]
MPNMLKSIPKNLLTGSLRVYSGYGENCTSVTLQNVRLERRKRDENKDGVIESKESVLCFFDCHFSSPADFDFTPRADKYIFRDGRELRLCKTETVFDGASAHHLEITFGEDYKINAACY